MKTLYGYVYLLTALVSGVLVGVVQTVVVTVAYVNSGYTISVVTREQVTETGATLRLAVLWWFVRSVTAVVVPVTIPSGRYAPVVGATETVGRASPLRTVNCIFIAVIAAVIVTVAQPVRFNAYVRLLAFEMVGRTRDVLWATVVRLV